MRMMTTNLRDVLTEVTMRGLDLERAAICAKGASCQ
jgi:hypothetical protein